MEDVIKGLNYYWKKICGDFERKKRELFKKFCADLFYISCNRYIKLL
jgi:hypothetical protein